MQTRIVPLLGTVFHAGARNYSAVLAGSVSHLARRRRTYASALSNALLSPVIGYSQQNFSVLAVFGIKSSKESEPWNFVNSQASLTQRNSQLTTHFISP